MNSIAMRASRSSWSLCSWNRSRRWSTSGNTLKTCMDFMAMACGCSRVGRADGSSGEPGWSTRRGSMGWSWDLCWGWRFSIKGTHMRRAARYSPMGSRNWNRGHTVHLSTKTTHLRSVCASDWDLCRGTGWDWMRSISTECWWKRNLYSMSIVQIRQKMEPGAADKMAYSVHRRWYSAQTGIFEPVRGRAVREKGLTMEKCGGNIRCMKQRCCGIYSLSTFFHVQERSPFPVRLIGSGRRRRLLWQNCRNCWML